MNRVIRIYEGYFNNVASDNDDIIRDIESNNNYNDSIDMHVIIYQYNKAYLKWVMKELDIDRDIKNIISVIKKLDCIDDCSFEVRYAPIIGDLVFVWLNKTFIETKSFPVRNINNISEEIKDALKEEYGYFFNGNGELKEDYAAAEVMFSIDIIVKPILDTTITYRQFSQDMHRMFNMLCKTVDKCGEQYGEKPEGVIIFKDTKNKWIQELWMTLNITPNELCLAYGIITGAEPLEVENSLHYEDVDDLAKEHKWLDKLSDRLNNR